MLIQRHLSKKDVRDKREKQVSVFAVPREGGVGRVIGVKCV